MNNYRESLIREFEELQKQEAHEQMEQMSDQELLEAISANLGLPPGTVYTDEQLKMIAGSPVSEGPS